MADVNEVIEWLGCLATNQHKCEGCPYNPHPGMGWIYGCMAGQGKIVDDARKLLKEQAELIVSLEGTIVKLTNAISETAPRLLTMEEAADAEICWIEVRSRRGAEPGKVRIYREDDYSAFINRLLPFVNENMPQHEYGEHWRCWSRRPTEKQMRETKWNE